MKKELKEKLENEARKRIASIKNCPFTLKGVMEIIRKEPLSYSRMYYKNDQDMYVMTFEQMEMLTKAELKEFVENTLGTKVPSDYTKESIELLIAFKVGVSA